MLLASQSYVGQAMRMFQCLARAHGAWNVSPNDACCADHGSAEENQQTETQSLNIPLNPSPSSAMHSKTASKDAMIGQLTGA